MDAVSIRMQVSNCIVQHAEALAKIWNYAGYSRDETEPKVALLLKSCQETFNDFLKLENGLLTELNASVESHRQTITEICSLLCLPPYFPPHGLTTCQLLQDLTNKVSELEQEKVYRKEELQRLRHEIITSSLLLGHTRDDIKKNLLPAIDIPSKEDLISLRLIVSKNNAILGPLVCQLNDLQMDVRRIAADIAYLPKTEREKQLFNLKYTLEEVHNVHKGGFDVDEEIERTADTLKGVLPNETDLEELKTMRLNLVKEKARLVGTCEELKAYLTSMWKRLGKSEEECVAFLKTCATFTPQSLQLLQAEADACRKERLQTIHTYLPIVKAELLELSKTCCLECQESSNLAKAEAKAKRDGSDELLDYLEHRIEELRTIFQQHRRVYEAIASYQTSVSTLQQVEQRIKDPSILSNRGGILLRTEKEKKRLLREVERLEKEAIAAVDEYEAENGHSFFLSNGQTFTQTIAEQKNGLSASGRGSRASSAIGRRPLSGNGVLSKPS